MMYHNNNFFYLIDLHEDHPLKLKSNELIDSESNLHEIILLPHLVGNNEKYLKS